MWLKAQNELAGLWPHVAMGPVERIVRPQSHSALCANKATRPVTAPTRQVKAESQTTQYDRAS